MHVPVKCVIGIKMDDKKHNRVDDIKDVILNANPNQNQNRISEKTLEIITLKNSLRLGNINKSEQRKLYKLLGFNNLYFKREEALSYYEKKTGTLQRIVEDYLNLSVSLGGKLLYHISEMFKTADVYNFDSSDKKNYD